MSGNAPAWPEGWDRIVLDETDSTNAHAARIADALTRPTWIMARRQTAARGRRGRVWSMPEGNFAATLVMRPEGEVAHTALRSFVAALALADALGGVTNGEVVITLKWPNDVLLNGGKVAGILLESNGDKRGLRHLAIGIGVNLAALPDTALIEPGATAPVSVLGETGITIAPEALLNALAVAYAGWERQFTTYGFTPIRNAWMARAARVGERISARTMTETISGTFVTVGPDGALVLHDPGGGWHSIPAADVFF